MAASALMPCSLWICLLIIHLMLIEFLQALSHSPANYVLKPCIFKNNGNRRYLLDFSYRLHKVTIK